MAKVAELLALQHGLVAQKETNIISNFASYLPVGLAETFLVLHYDLKTSFAQFTFTGAPSHKSFALLIPFQYLLLEELSWHKYCCPFHEIAIFMISFLIGI